MERMTTMESFVGAEWNHLFLEDGIVEDETDSADREGKDQALDIEAGRLGEIKKRWRIPIFGDKEGLGQAQGQGDQAHDQHFLAEALLPKIKKPPNTEND